MDRPNVQWRINQSGLSQCCVQALDYEMYRRDEENDDLMIEGDTFKCGNCGTEMVCDSSGASGKLRWAKGK